MTPFDFLPHRVDILFPTIRLGTAVAKRQVNVRRAIEYLQTGLYRQEFSSAGEFVGIVYAPMTDKPSRPQYIPEEMPPIEVSGLRFVQPQSATPRYMRTVTQDHGFATI